MDMTIVVEPILAQRFPAEAGFVLLVFLGFAGLAIFFRLMGGALDHERIRQYVRERGGQVVSIQWSPFGRGWFGEKRDRIYEVVYRDADGNEHLATCKTSMLAGVYWTEDEVAQRSPKASHHVAPPAAGVQFLDQDALERENRELRQEVARLRQELKRRES